VVLPHTEKESRARETKPGRQRIEVEGALHLGKRFFIAAEEKLNRTRSEHAFRQSSGLTPNRDGNSVPQLANRDGHRVCRTPESCRLHQASGRVPTLSSRCLPALLPISLRVAVIRIRMRSRKNRQVPHRPTRSSDPIQLPADNIGDSCQTRAPALRPPSICSSKNGREDTADVLRCLWLVVMKSRDVRRR